jgi:endonuclease/exonuclease/phosphatase family metal-dependent hydrolase
VGATALRVASFNLRNGRALDGRHAWPFRRRVTAEAVDGLHADLAGLQEAYGCQWRYLVRRLDRYDAVGRGRDPRGGEAAPLLLARERVRALEHRTRWFGDTPDRPGARLPGARHPRIATIASVEVDGTTRVQVANVHLDSVSVERRLRSTTQLVGWLDPEVPGIVLGDLNAGPDAPELQPLLDAGFRHALPAGAGGTAHQWTGRTDGPRIDHILVRGDIAVAGAEVQHPRPGGRLPSDHWPVVADLLV